MRIFASDRVAALMRKLGMEEGRLSHPMLTRSIENAQRRVEGHHFDIRKQLIKFDDITNDQRKLVYQERDDVLARSDMGSGVLQMIARVAQMCVAEHIPEEGMRDEWALDALQALMQHEFNLSIDMTPWLADTTLTEPLIEGRVVEAMQHHYRQKRDEVGAEVMGQVEKAIVLQTLDHYWREHLAALTQLRQGIHWRSYAQKDPMQEYEREAFALFEHFLQQVKRGTVEKLMTVQITVDSAQTLQDQAQQTSMPMQPANHVGRNDPCPCGSTLKYKRCCGKITDDGRA